LADLRRGSNSLNSDSGLFDASYISSLEFATPFLENNYLYEFKKSISKDGFHYNVL